MSSILKVDTITDVNGNAIISSDGSGNISIPNLTTTGDINLGDSDKINLGAGNDLQIYHDGSNSLITDVGTGNLFVRADNLVLDDTSSADYLYGVSGGAVTVYYAGSPKLATTSTGIDVTGNVIADGLTVDTDTLYVDSSNNRVGIGIDNPTGKLNIVSGSSGSYLLNLDYNDNTDGGGFYQSGSTDLSLFLKNSSATQTVQIATAGDSFFNGGNVGIGITTPTELLHVDGKAEFGDFDNSGVTSGVRFNIDSTDPEFLFSTTTTGTGVHQRFYNPNGNVGTIFTTGSSTVYSTSSDYRLKENVIDMDNAIDRVKALSPKRFNFIADADTTLDGFLAHEVSDIVPEAISGEKDATKEEEYEVTPAVLDDNGNVVTEAVMGTRTVPDYQGIDQSKLVPLLTGALQEAIAKIEELETRLTALEA